MGQAFFSRDGSRRCGRPLAAAAARGLRSRPDALTGWSLWVLGSVVLHLVSAAAQAADPHGAVDGRGGHPAPFASVWVVDRSAEDVYPVLTALVRPDRFTAVVLTSEDSPRTDSLDHLLGIVPEGISHWVSRAPVPVGLSVDRVEDPEEIVERRLRGPLVVCSDQALLPLAQGVQDCFITARVETVKGRAFTQADGQG